MIMEEQDSKRLRSNNNKNNTDSVFVVDRISGLPNSILGVILSFLRTKQALATSILSKRWKSAWLDVHNLDLCNQDFVKPYDSDSDAECVAPDSDENIAFIRFVSRALLLIVGRPLNKFRLFCHGMRISSHLVCWIDAAILRNVHDIDLYLRDGDILRLPISGFNCDSLRSLKIDGIFFLYDTTMVCLPRLETLILEGVRFTSEESFEKLINGCPMLHYLKIYVYRPSRRYLEERENNNDDGEDDENYDDNVDDGEDNNDDGEDDEHDDDNVDDGEDDNDGNDDNDNDDGDDAEEGFMYIVSSPTLRHLDMYVWNRCTLKLTVPSVENLKLFGGMSQIFVEKSLCSLVAADIGELNDIPHISFVEAVRALEHAKVLTLSVSAMRALGLATTSLSTDFKRLVKLVAKTYCCSVQDIIQNSEILEDLIIEGGYWCSKSTIAPFDHSRWTAPVVVPRCLSQSLKKVRFNGYKGLEDEREMIRYILEHGTVLEVMQIYCSSHEDGERLALLQKICEFPRKSPACKIQFSVYPHLFYPTGW